MVKSFGNRKWFRYEIAPTKNCFSKGAIEDNDTEARAVREGAIGRAFPRSVAPFGARSVGPA